MKKTLFLALLSAACTVVAIPVPWRVDTAVTAARTFSAYRGETLAFEPAFALAGGTVLSNLTCTIFYQTNGMGAAWWKCDGTTFAPSNDVGAACYRLFVRAEKDGETLYRANGLLKMLGSPGATPNALPLPTETIDFLATEPLNAPWATTNALEAAIAAIDVTDQLKAYATTNELNAATNATLAAANAYTDSRLPDDQYLRTDIWTLGYVPWSEDAESTVTTTTNVRGKVISSVAETERTEGYVKLEPFHLAPFSRTVVLASAEVTDGEAELSGSDPLVVHGTSATPSDITVRATTDAGETRSVTFRLSSAVKKSTTVSKRYTDDASSLGTARKDVNDLWLKQVAALQATGETVTDSCGGTATEIFTASYFRDAQGANTASAGSYVYSNVYRNDTTCLKRGVDGGRNSGNGGSYVLGKRLVGNAAHWYGGVWAGRVCHVETSDGERHALTMTGETVDLAEWAVNKWGREGFLEKFGFSVSLISDVRLIEVAEEIPDECVPALLPYAEAAKAFEAESEGGDLDLSCGGWTIGQNNAVYPVWLEDTTAYWSYGFANTYTATFGATIRSDCLAQYNAAPSFWTVRGHESGRPAYMVTPNAAVLVGSYHTLYGGGSYIAAADVIAEYERERGRDPDETLKRITAEDL